MKKRNNYDFEAMHTANIFALVRDILSDKSIEAISYEDRHGAISIARNTHKETTFAIGFTADIDGNDNDDEGDDEE